MLALKAVRDLLEFDLELAGKQGPTPIITSPPEKTWDLE